MKDTLHLIERFFESNDVDKAEFFDIMTAVVTANKIYEPQANMYNINYDTLMSNGNIYDFKVFMSCFAPTLNSMKSMPRIGIFRVLHDSLVIYCKEHNLKLEGETFTMPTSSNVLRGSSSVNVYEKDAPKIEKSIENICRNNIIETPEEKFIKILQKKFEKNEVAVIYQLKINRNTSLNETYYIENKNSRFYRKVSNLLTFIEKSESVMNKIEEALKAI